MADTISEVLVVNNVFEKLYRNDSERSLDFYDFSFRSLQPYRQNRR